MLATDKERRMAVWLGIAGLVLGFAFAQSGIDGFGSIFGAAVGALIGICIRSVRRPRGIARAAPMIYSPPALGRLGPPRNGGRWAGPV